MLFMWRHRDVFPVYDTLTAEVFLRSLWDGTPWGLFQWYANEHRPAFPMIVFVIDHLLGGTTGPLSTIAMFISALTLAGLFLLAAPSTHLGASRLDARHALFGAIAAVMMIWPGHWENLVWPSQLQIYAALVAGIGALVLVVRAPSGETVPWKRAAAVGALLFASCFSFAFGFVLAAGVTAVAVLRFGLSRLAAACAVALASALGLYVILFWGLNQFGTSAANLAAPGRILIFILRYVGAPMAVATVKTVEMTGLTFPAAARLTAAVLFGLVALAAAVCVFVSVGRAWRKGQIAALSPYHWIVVAMSIFAFGSGLVTALARLTYPDSFPVDTQRYYVATACFWMALLAYAAFELRRWRILAAASLAMVAVVFVVSGFTFLDAVRAHAAADRKAGVAAMSRLSDAWPMFWLPDLVPGLYGQFESERSLLYDRAWARAFGRPVDETGLRRDDALCAGAVATAAPFAGVDGVDRSYQLEGTLARPAPVDWFIVSDARGRVVGFGSAQRLADEGGTPQRDTPWVAFARDATLPLAVDAVVTGETACRVGVIETADGAPVPSQRPPYRTDFEGAAAAPPPDEALQCPEKTERVRWVDGRLLCMAMR